MVTIVVSISREHIKAYVEGKLTSGMVGVTAEFAFDGNWDGLEKTAVFRAGGNSYCIRDMENTVTVPWEILTQPGCTLYVGAYGISTDGMLAIPTLWAEVGIIEPGADPAATEGCDPTLPVWKEAIDKADAVFNAAQAGQFDGYTPVRGKDYWTDADVAEIKAYVEDAILGGAW